MAKSMKMEDLLLGSKEIFERAELEYKPQGVVMMFSGGDDSLTAYHVAKELGIKIDFVIHGNTRTGIPDTTLFSRKKVEEMGDKYLEADAGNSYLNYVMRKGFFGKGLSAHAFSYHILKQDHFERVVSQHIRQRKRNFPILFLNGGRRDESENRKKQFLNPIKVTTRRKNDIWVNLINDWSKPDCKNYLSGNSIERCSVAINLCRSGECMCGTMQSNGDRKEAAFFYKQWGKDLDELEKKVKELHGFGWGENKPKQKDKSQLELFQPMCVGCTKNIAI
jgi:3'-phosphoadenosine 5'-phosphosulfate sulfotransferase (PAPS reductase)/FAD synthetase